MMDGADPAALVGGRGDPMGLARHRRALPNARILERDAGHFVQERCAQAVREAADALGGAAL